MATWEEHCKRRGIPYTPPTKPIEPERARNDSGEFVGDDPSTPNVNEAWKGGKSPAKKPPAKKKVASKKKPPAVPKASSKKKKK